METQLPPPVAKAVITACFGSVAAWQDWMLAVKISTSVEAAARRVKRETLTSIKAAIEAPDGLSRRAYATGDAERYLAVIDGELARRGDDDELTVEQMSHDWLLNLSIAASPEEAVARMETETLRRMLAWLDHPNTAALFEENDVARTMDGDRQARVATIRDELRRRGEAAVA